MAETTVQLGESTADFEAERLILDVTELILGLMEHEGLTRSELAERIGKSKGHVSQLLNGERNMTLRTLAEIVHAVGHRIEVRVSDLQAPPNYPAADDLLYEAWAVIANAGWDGAGKSEGWQEAAVRWRDKWHAYLDETTDAEEE